MKLATFLDSSDQTATATTPTRDVNDRGCLGIVLDGLISDAQTTTTSNWDFGSVQSASHALAHAIDRTDNCHNSLLLVAKSSELWKVVGFV